MGDYYETLGVERTASADEIKSKYRKLAMKYHPDRNQGDKDAEEKFKKITEAYETLGDEQKRREYDTFGSARQNRQNYWEKTQSRENPFQSNGSGFYGFSKETEDDDPFAQWAGNGTRFYYYTTQSRQTSPQNREDVVPDVIRNVIFAVFGFVLLGLPLLRILGVLLFFKGVFGALRSLRRLV